MSDAPKPASLADRITQPAAAPTTSPATWDEEVSSAADPAAAKDDSATADQGQVDGQVEPLGGSGLHEATEEVEVKLSDLQSDTANPLYSAQSFEELGINEQILKGIYSMNFKKPSKIQERALPLLLSDPPRNMIAQSQSGTGKTAAFVITILSRLDYSKPNQPQALCLAPSRELARQIEGVVRSIGQFVDGLTIQAAVPGAVERGARLQAMVVVGTPGTVMDLLKRRQFDASQMKVLCLDEADNMLDQQGLGDQCLRVKQLIPGQTQILLFSATFPDMVMRYAEQFSPNANQIKLKRDELTVSGIKQMYMDCPSDDGKYDILANLYGLMTIGSSIIFVKRRETADKIAARLIQDGHQVVAVHGAFEGSERDSILERFRLGQAKVLITTNVLARGIDVQSVSMVINYDIPMKGRSDSEPDAETYLHRIGRTGRFGRVGVSISFVFDRKSFVGLQTIAEHYGIDLIRLDTDDWDNTESVVKNVIKSSRAPINMTNN
ncbi:putative ATP-dependent RNA helicase dbp5 [Venustampulla echinocandica]|uniref:RNA helicase n=1 Tax=Venustampulla echinocandica TaxID=2656787 RepID=A0A370TTZ0_9HELO|nr:putative ATP-dependent RNA helicase dbp5 [Venustampulla echinocandica]RDL38993.1 putative ATP-dependent RNA helicase dbp5 [Venustampulla echinocandica]